MINESLLAAIKEPGMWVLLILISCSLIQCAASLALRKTRKRFADLVAEVMQEGNLTRGDKAWLKSQIDKSKGTHLLLSAPFAPFAILGAFVLGFVEASKERSFNDSSEYWHKIGEKLTKDEVVEAYDADPTKGRLWLDDRRQEIQNASYTIETWNNPISVLWISAWLIISAPLLVISYFVTGSLRPFASSIWKPLQEPAVAALSLLMVKLHKNAQ